MAAMKRVLPLFLALVLLLSACGPGSTPRPDATGRPMPEPVLLTPVPTHPLPATDSTGSPPPTSPDRELPAVAAAIEILARDLGVPEDRVILVDVQPADWPDSCLGSAGPGEMCADVITPGYRVLLRVGVSDYEFHTNSDGTSVRQAERITPGLPGRDRPVLVWELAVAYHREGGIAGFCDDVKVYLTGYALVGDCTGSNTAVQLTASQLQQVYGWYDNTGPIEYSYTDPAVADAMTITLSMPGKGSEPAGEATIQAILEFCAELLAQPSLDEQADKSALEAAGNTLREFFTALYVGDYVLGAKLYGGDTQILQDWNPDIQNDLPAWLARGCNQNGLVCLLPRSLTYIGPDADGALQFVVEFNNPDGTLFQRGPCCGEETGPVESAFLYRVVQQDDLWLVLDLPPYVP